MVSWILSATTLDIEVCLISGPTRPLPIEEDCLLFAFFEYLKWIPHRADERTSIPTGWKPNWMTMEIQTQESYQGHVPAVDSGCRRIA